MTLRNDQLVKVAKALSDENRLQILDMLKSGEKCACVLLDAMKITQPTLSHHMKILCDAGLVRGRKEGRWVHYSIDGDTADEAVQTLRDKLDVNPAETGEGKDCCCCSDESA